MFEMLQSMAGLIEYLCILISILESMGRTMRTNLSYLTDPLDGLSIMLALYYLRETSSSFFGPLRVPWRKAAVACCYFP